VTRSVEVEDHGEDYFVTIRDAADGGESFRFHLTLAERLLREGRMPSFADYVTSLEAAAEAVLRAHQQETDRDRVAKSVGRPGRGRRGPRGQGGSTRD
jgi:hypothetical protein